ncbi:MAG: ComF family protein [Azovibrio sp.]
MRKSISIPAQASMFLEKLQHWGSNLLPQSLLPQSCQLCGQFAGHTPVCAGCIQDLPRLPEHHCPICRESTPHGETCGGCQIRSPHFDQVLALYTYAFPVDRLIQQLKYSAQFSLARWWGKTLAPQVPEQVSRIMPLPLHPQRLAERGFNQALEIAKPLAHTLNLPLDPNSLKKTRTTLAQTELSLKLRKTNLSKAFECSSDLSGEHILLVDDVLTTGTTLNEAARILKQRGCSRVTACVVARALKNGVS